MRKLTLLYLLLTGNALAKNGNCFHNNYLPFFQNYSFYDSSISNKIDALETACKEISWSKMNEATNVGIKAAESIVKTSHAILLGSVPAAFSRLMSTPEGKQYIAELNRIKSIENPIERIRQTYELAGKNSGKYDYDFGGLKSWASGFIIGTNRPENLLKNNRQNGTIGVCREFASLLQWSLMQVSRYSDSKNMALNKNDFSSETVWDIVPRSTNNSDEFGGHVWVRINCGSLELR